MIDSLVYSIPASMVAAYRGRSIIVRSRNPAEIVETLAMEDLARVSYLQILSLGAEPHPLMHWGHMIPVDLVVQDVEEDLPLLYKWSPLPANHPVRVTVPVTTGFSKVVKLALSLDFAVKLNVYQPSPAVTEEMLRVLHAYLHQTTVTQPIEYFHSMFLALYREEPITLWAIQEEDPAYVRYIADDGRETLSMGCVGREPRGDITFFVQKFKEELKAHTDACSCCEFFEHCTGYFRLPGEEYQCEGVKIIFQILKEAAEQLRGDLTSFHSRGGEEP